VIVDGIWGLVAGFLETVLNLFPAFTPPTLPGDTCALSSGFGCKAAWAGQYLGLLHNWVDLSALIDVVTIVVAVLVATTLAKGVIWLYGKIPGKAS